MRQPYVYVANEFIQKISPGGHAIGHGINRRNTRVIKMQNVTLLDWPINIICELHTAKEFHEWQPVFIKH